MAYEKHTDPICQSCSDLLKTLDDKGTEADGTKSDDYCQYCYQDGEFTEPEITLKEMIVKVAAIRAKNPNITLDEARSYLESLLPTLKRWR